jgi:hypothetical protein
MTQCECTSRTSRSLRNFDDVPEVRMDSLSSSHPPALTSGRGIGHLCPFLNTTIVLSVCQEPTYRVSKSIFEVQNNRIVTRPERSQSLYQIISNTNHESLRCDRSVRGCRDGLNLHQCRTVSACEGCAKQSAHCKRHCNDLPENGS